MLAILVLDAAGARNLVLAFILLHMLDGSPIYVRSEEILAIAEPSVMYGPRAGATILLHEKWFAVTEKPAEIAKLATAVSEDVR
jgi:hypothetical protein